MRPTLLKEARMRGDGIEPQPHMWSYVPLEQRIPAEHPLRPLRAMVDVVLRELSPQFDQLYSNFGRPSIPPEHLLRALLLQVLYSVRSERLLMEQLDYNLLFRWFVGLAMDDRIWDATVFTKNRDRLLRGDIACAFFARVRAQAEQRGLLSDEHFTVDGTLIDAWASLKSFQRKDAPRTPPDDPGNPTVNFHGERRSNATHASTTDPQALLYRKGAGREAKRCYQGHVLMENRHGLAVDGCLTAANGYGERAAALEMVGPWAEGRRVTLGADKAYDTRDFVEALRGLQVTPHVAQNTSNRSSAIDGRTTRHAGYEVSQQKRKRIEVRLAQDDRAAAANAIPRPLARRLDVCLQLGGLQPGAHSEPHGAGRMRSHGEPSLAALAHSQTVPRGIAPATSSSVVSPPSVSCSPAFSAAC
jgi:transposase